MNPTSEKGWENTGSFVAVGPEKTVTLTNHDHQKPTKMVTGIVLVAGYYLKCTPCTAHQAADAARAAVYGSYDDAVRSQKAPCEEAPDNDAGGRKKLRRQKL